MAQVKRYAVIVDDVVWKTFDSEQDANDFKLSVAGKVQEVEVRPEETISKRVTQ